MIVAITSSKGGAGKSTCSALAYTSIFDRFNHKVCLVSIDPQNSIPRIRNREIGNIKNSASGTSESRYIMKNIERFGVPFPKVYQMDINKEWASIKKKLEVLDEEYDLVFVDFPGSLELHINTLYILKLLDKIFIPIYVDESDFDSVCGFVAAMLKMKKSDKIKADINLFFNKYVTSEKQRNYRYFEDAKKSFHKLNWPLMKNHVKDEAIFGRFSTILPPKLSIARFNIFHWVEELYEKCNIEIKK